MGEVSLTLGEILDIPGYQLFLPHNIIEYDRLQALIINNYYNREIAYDTPDYFRMKLNYYLELNAPVYNKMLQSERVVYDPFVTDYVEYDESVITDAREGFREGTSTRSTATGVKIDGKRAQDLEQYQGKDQSRTESNRVGTDIGSNLYSQTDNESFDKYVTADKDGQENLKILEKTHEDTNYQEDKRIDYQSDQEGYEHAERDTRKVSDRNQSDRQWTERGNSKAHNLDVNSNTPQMMLFNQPNHYYGTGTADGFGVVAKDAQGNDYYQEYLEDNIEALDSAQRQINGGDTPWFNYATTAGNTLGHDSYDKSGTETFKINDTTTGDDDLDKDTESSRTDVTNQHIEGEKHTDSERNETDDKTYHEDTSGSESSLNSKATNANEHDKRDTTEKANGQTDKQNQYRKVADMLSHASNKTRTDAGIQTERSHELGKSSDTLTTSVRKGRSGNSPSALLQEYRGTIEYSADRWMIGELEKVFLQLY